jgi:hypothetical protein
MRRMPDLYLQSGAFFFWRLLLFILICGVAVPVWASREFSPAIEMDLRPGRSALADLDGDHVVDIASGTKVRQTEQGYEYRVDLHLSSVPDAKSFIVYSDEATGLNVRAVDVDGDHNFDLVVTSHLQHRPIGVWLNDGNGRFIRDDPARYDPSVWQEGRSISSSGTTSTPVSSSEQRRPRLALDYGHTDFRKFQFFPAVFHPQSVSLVSGPIESARFRAPPE